MEKNNRPDLKQRTKEWLNRYGKYILAGVALLTVLAVAFTISSLGAPAGAITDLPYTTNRSCISEVSYLYQDGTAVVIPFDDTLASVQSTLYVADEVHGIGVSTEAYIGDPEDEEDFDDYGVYFSTPSEYPSGVSSINLFTRPLVTNPDPSFVYNPFQYLYVGHNSNPTDYSSYASLIYNVEYIDADSEVFTTEAINVSGYVFGTEVSLPFTALNSTALADAEYVRISLTFTCSVPTSINIPTPTNFDIVEVNFYESIPLVDRDIIVEQPIYTDYNPVTIITSAIDSLFDIEWLGGISFGVFFALIVAIPVLFFVFKAFLGG